MKPVRRSMRDHRLVLSATALVCGLLAIGAVVVAAAGADASAGTGAPGAPRVLGPGLVTIRIAIDQSHFHPTLLHVRPHTEVRFVIANHDPIGHEFIIGGPEVHARHANGHEASHPPVPGEVSVPPETTAATTFAFHAPGPVEFACHLPGHYQYGMHGIVEVVGT
jgi:uncharacterized cupredoxin-like copper-binding protein